MRLSVGFALILALVPLAAHAAREGRRAARTARTAIAAGFPTTVPEGVAQTRGDYELIHAAGPPPRLLVVSPGTGVSRTHRIFGLDGALWTAFRFGGPHGYAFSFGAKSGLLARERADGTWMIQSVRGGFSAATIVPDRRAMRMAVHGF